MVKSIKVALLIKISIPILIIGGCFGIEKFLGVRAEDFSGKPRIVSEDNSLLIADNKPLEIVSKQSYGNVEGLSENLGFIGDDEALVSIGMGSEEFYKKYPDKLDKYDDKYDNALNDIHGNIYWLKLSDLEKKPLGIEMRDLYSDLVPNVNKINYVKENNYSIYDLKNDSNYDLKNYSKDNLKYESNFVYETPSSKDSPANLESPKNIGNWSKDGNYLITYDNGDLNLYNVTNKSSKILKVKSDTLWIAIIPGFYSEDGENIYFIGAQPKDNRYERRGIFKINSSSGKIEEILVLPYSDKQSADSSKESSIQSIDYCVLDGGKKIILSATIEGQAGGYIYDVDSKKFYNVISPAIELYCPSIWVSPDKTKVIYANRELENNKEQWNLYAAKINGNSLTDKICIYKNINFSGSLNNELQWSGDSKKILFFTGNEQIDKNNFSFKDKNEVNIITFK